MSAGLVATVNQILGGPKTVVVRMDSMQLGQTGNGAIFGVVEPPPIAEPVLLHCQSGDSGPRLCNRSRRHRAARPSEHRRLASGDGLANDVAPIDPAFPSKFEGGAAAFKFSAKVTMTLPSNSYLAGQGLGCTFADPGFDANGNCAENGGRWFDGPSPQNNETKDHPNAFDPTVDFNNAGALTGVTVINEPHAYTMFSTEWRNIGVAVAGGAARAADFNVYWGAGWHGRFGHRRHPQRGRPVLIRSSAGSWGILNTAAAGGPARLTTARAVLTQTDIGCVEPLRTKLSVIRPRMPCDPRRGGEIEPDGTAGQPAQLRRSANPTAAVTVDRPGGP